MPTLRKKLRSQSKVVRRGIIKQMRKDLIYLIKPKPRLWPNWLWHRRLKRLLYFNPEKINIKLK